MTQNTLHIALVQASLVWEYPEKNRVHFTDFIKGITQPVDLIVLPEMFTTGFTMNAATMAESMNGDTVAWMQKMAKQKQAALVGSLIIEDDKNYYNRLLFVHPNGTIETYDKRHRFSLAGEDKVFSAGTKKLIVNFKGWKLCPLICYDLRFPVWARNVEDYDLLLYVANWPAARINAWDALLRARAIENMSYCIGVNRVGVDGNGHEYPGHSSAFDVLGLKMDTIAENDQRVEIVAISKNELEAQRAKLSFLQDRDQFSLK